MIDSYSDMPSSYADNNSSVAKVAPARQRKPRKPSAGEQLEFRYSDQYTVLPFSEVTTTVWPVEFLRQKRIERGLTQAAAAHKIGKHATTWSQYEAGLILPDLKTFRRIARVLQCDERRLLNALLRGYTGTASVTNLHAERAKRRRG